MTSSTGPQADRSGRSQGFTLRERAACLQLLVFPSFDEGDGPRHASCETVSPSNLGRPLITCDVRRATCNETSILDPVWTAVKLLSRLDLRRFLALTCAGSVPIMAKNGRGLPSQPQQPDRWTSHAAARRTGGAAPGHGRIPRPGT